MRTGLPALPLAVALVVAGGSCATARSNASPGSMHREIVAMMTRSAQSWNRGDLGAFVNDYVDSDRTTYIGRRGVVRGRAAIRAAYLASYGRQFTAGGVHDSLSFENIEVDSLAPGVANVIAWYVLARGDSLIARGPTSLVMLQAGGRWRILHDHSS